MFITRFDLDNFICADPINIELKPLRIRTVEVRNEVITKVYVVF